ncbi:glutamate--tRNA ligase [Candidatus Microgenomates bacterium]|nr:glutamate--tRNA ligase [Candidatus Microgenomates bacterium]
MIRTRIAPSPTGEDLHIGNVYTALINYVFAKKNQGKFIIRIEDTDRTRLVPGSKERILASLKWLGINYDEGPDVGGPFAPYEQSKRLDLYKKYAQELVDKGAAYYCFCTPEILEQMRKDQQAKKELPHYDQRCKKLSKAQIKDKLEKKEKYVIRLAVPSEGTTTFNDLIRGEISFENKLIDDQVLLKSDGYPTYHLGVVVDDHLMEISHVIRAEEWISSTPKHVLLYKAFGWTLPVFAHGPILRNPDRSKLSKRKNPVWASWYREEGFLPEAILNYLALMGWSLPAQAGMPDGREIFTIKEMMKSFRLEDIKPVGPAFDLTKLLWMNGEYIRKTQNSKLKGQIYEFFNKRYSKEEIEKTLPLVKDRMKKLSEWESLTDFFRKAPTSYEIPVNKDHLKNVLTVLEKKDWSHEILEQTSRKVAEELKVKAGDLFMSIRIALTGKKATPPLFETMLVLEKEESLARLKRAVSL